MRERLAYLSQRERTGSAVAACAVVALIAMGLVLGLRVTWRPQSAEVLISIDLRQPSPAREEPRRPKRAASNSAPKGAPAPAGLKNRATPVVAPPRQPVILPAPIVVATQAAMGDASAIGAAVRRGPGRGAGGVGDGTGGGGRGGDGYGDGAVVGPRQSAGRLKFSDIPESLLGAGESASVAVRYDVGVDGRVRRCRLDRPSGKAGIDALACRLIERRFRFRPARDENGRPVPSTVIETHSWSAAPDEPRPDR